MGGLESALISFSCVKQIKKKKKKKEEEKIVIFFDNGTSKDWII